MVVRHDGIVHTVSRSSRLTLIKPIAGDSVCLTFPMGTIIPGLSGNWMNCSGLMPLAGCSPHTNHRPGHLASGTRDEFIMCRTIFPSGQRSRGTNPA